MGCEHVVLLTTNTHNTHTLWVVCKKVRTVCSSAPIIRFKHCTLFNSVQLSKDQQCVSIPRQRQEHADKLQRVVNSYHKKKAEIRREFNVAKNKWEQFQKLQAATADVEVCKTREKKGRQKKKKELVTTNADCVWSWVTCFVWVCFVVATTPVGTETVG